MTTHTSPEQVRAERQALIDRAVAYMDATSPAELSEIVARLGWKPELRRDPSKLRNLLVAGRDFPGGLFGPYKAAQKLLNAAGLYDYPTPATATKTRCETVDQIVEWTDSTGRLNIAVGDLIVDADQFEEVSEIHYDPGTGLRVAVGFKGRNSLVFKPPAAPVAVRRYIETGEE